MPKAADRLKNAMPSLLLRSPLHGVLSDKYLIVEFTGRKSGKRYATPVAYVREGDTVYLSTDSPWWRNFVDGAPVQLVLKGRKVKGTATAITDPLEAFSIVRRLVDAIPSYAKPAGLQREDGKVSDAEVQRGVDEGRVGIRIALEER